MTPQSEARLIVRLIRTLCGYGVAVCHRYEPACFVCAHAFERFRRLGVEERCTLSGDSLGHDSEERTCWMFVAHCTTALNAEGRVHTLSRQRTHAQPRRRGLAISNESFHDYFHIPRSSYSLSCQPPATAGAAHKSSCHIRPCHQPMDSTVDLLL